MAEWIEELTALKEYCKIFGLISTNEKGKKAHFLHKSSTGNFKSDCLYKGFLQEINLLLDENFTVHSKLRK